VEALLTCDRTGLRRAAREAASGYGWDRTFTALLGIYEEVVGR
jgi:hypothetical protein